MKGLPDLTVMGMGALGPFGSGVPALLEAPVAEPTREPLLGLPGKTAPVRRVDLKSPPLLRWQQEPRLRRASPLALFLMEAASQALEAHPDLDRSRLGLVCAFGTGSICYSRRFYVDAFKKGKRFASPALFPETVYNSPVSHIAAILGISGASYSVMGDESSWVEALRVAQVWLATGKTDHVLVLGAEELDAITVEAFQRCGWIKQGAVPSEGAGALLVGDQGPGPVLRPDPNTATFRSKALHAQAWKSMLDQEQAESPMVLPGNVVPESLATTWGGGLDRSGPDWGAAFTASAAWATIQMLARQQSGGLLISGSNCGVSRVSVRM